MKRRLINNPLFRLLSPVFSGIVVYLLILLINNNVEQLQDQFLGEELYFCIGLSLLIQESSIFLLWLYRQLAKNTLTFYGLLIQLLASLALSVVLVSLSVRSYYKYVLGFSPNTEELWMFNSIYCMVTIVYILLHISYQYLHQVNTSKLNNELLLKQLIQDDFKQFKEGINPDLLMDCFEALIVLIRREKEKVDDLVDHIAATYRYILTRKDRQLVEVEEELLVMNRFVQLMNYLPYRKVQVQNSIQSSFLFVPGSLLKIIEQIIRSTIISAEIPLIIRLTETEESLEVNYDHNDSIHQSFDSEEIMAIRQVYKVYSSQNIDILEDENTRRIRIPKLKMQAKT